MLYTYLRAREDIGVSFDPGNDFAENDAIGEDISSLIVPKACETLWSHPVWGSYNGQLGCLVTVNIPST